MNEWINKRVFRKRMGIAKSTLAYSLGSVTKRTTRVALFRALRAGERGRMPSLFPAVDHTVMINGM